MPVRRDPRKGGWFFRTIVKTPDGKKLRLYGTTGVPGPYQDLAATKIGAQEAEQRAIKNALASTTGAATPPEKKEVPRFEEWFNGRFWTEWVVARRNKPSEVESKRSIFNVHLGPAFGDVAVDEIDVPMISRFRAKLIGAKKSDKTINNILAVLSKVLSYAAQARVIPARRALACSGSSGPRSSRGAWRSTPGCSQRRRRSIRPGMRLVALRRGGLADR
jgi:hypothetical protein